MVSLTSVGEEAVVGECRRVVFMDMLLYLVCYGHHLCHVTCRYCGLSNANAFSGSATLVAPVFSDANGFSNAIYYSTFRLTDVNNDGKADICGRGIAGIYCALSTSFSSVGFGPHFLYVDNFSDAYGWNNVTYPYYSTIQPAHPQGESP